MHAVPGRTKPRAAAIAGPEDARRPLLVGIGGDSGSGKSTLAAAFYDLFGGGRIATICLDDYHSLDRAQRSLVGLTPLNPRANDFARMEENLWALKRGETVDKPVYDHSDGSLRGPERLEPREVIIVQGLHPFLVSGVRHVFDLKVWLDPEPELRLLWKVQRDVAKRGYSREQVEAQLDARRADTEAFIAPQRREADMVVRFCRPEPVLRDMGHLNVRITQRHRLPRLGFDRHLAGVGRVGIETDIVDDDGVDADVISVDGRIDADEACLLEDVIWAHIDERHHHLRRPPPASLGTYEADTGRNHSDPLALCQLVLAHRILSAQKSYLLRVTAAEHDHLAGEHAHPSWPHRPSR